MSEDLSPELRARMAMVEAAAQASAMTATVRASDPFVPAPELALPTILADEVQLLDWSETAKGGCKIVLQLTGPEALEPFRSLTLAKRGMAGQRLACMMKLLPDDDSEPNPGPEIPSSVGDRPAGDPEVAKTGASSLQAVLAAVSRLRLACRDGVVHRWLVTEHGVTPPRRAWGKGQRQRWAETAVCRILEIPELTDIDADCLPRVEAFISTLPA